MVARQTMQIAAETLVSLIQEAFIKAVSKWRIERLAQALKIENVELRFVVPGIKENLFIRVVYPPTEYVDFSA